MIARLAAYSSPPAAHRRHHPAVVFSLLERSPRSADICSGELGESARDRHTPGARGLSRRARHHLWRCCADRPQLQRGEYWLSPALSPRDDRSLCVRRVYPWIRDPRAHRSGSCALRRRSLVDAASSHRFATPLARSLGIPARSLEGSRFPETYPCRATEHRAVARSLCSIPAAWRQSGARARARTRDHESCPRLDRREGDRRRCRAPDHRVGVREPAAPQHAPRVRSHRHLRAARFRWQPAPQRPRRRRQPL